MCILIAECQVYMCLIKKGAAVCQPRASATFVGRNILFCCDRIVAGHVRPHWRFGDAAGGPLMPAFEDFRRGRWSRAIQFGAVQIGLVLVWLVLPAGIGEARAQGRLEARYQAWLAGIPVARGAWVVEIAEDRFTASADGGSSGLRFPAARAPALPRDASSTVSSSPSASCRHTHPIKNRARAFSSPAAT